MKEELYGIVVAISLTLLFCAAGADAAGARDSERWTRLTADMYINIGSIVREPGDKVSLWIKIIPDERSDMMYEARSRLIAKGRDDLALSYDYSGLLSEIDCPGKKHRELVTILYDVRRNIVGSVEQHPASWSDIMPGSDFHTLQMAVCN